MRIIFLMILITAPLSASAGNEGGIPGYMPMDDCGGLADYYDLVTSAAAHDCGQAMAGFQISHLGATITPIEGLKDPNLFYSVFLRDRNTDRTLAAVVKCDVDRGEASLLTLTYATPKANGQCPRHAK